jgi:hypothetical protein
VGWEIGYDDTWARDIGYGVPAVCDHPDCKVKIDRGLGYVCGGEPYGGEQGCGLFFCSEHLFHSESEPEWSERPPSHAEEVEYYDSNDERGAFVCERCRDWNERDTAEGEFKPFEPKPDVEEWLRHKAIDPSWAKWREEQNIPEMV